MSNDPERPQAGFAPLEPATIPLHDTETGTLVGRISRTQLQFLIDQLEEESETDQDYYIDGDTIDVLADAGADAGLVELLRGALAGRDGMELRWSEE